MAFSVLPRSVPEGTETFEVYGTPGVDVYISPSMERSRKPADTRRWHCDEGLEIIVVMNSPSNDLNESHVSGSPGLRVRRGGSDRAPQRPGALSFPRAQGSLPLEPASIAT